MTYIQAFEKIKEKLGAVDKSVFTRDFAIQVNLVNKDCAGAFYVANLNGEFSVEPYDYRDNSAMITLMQGDFVKLVEGKLNIEKAVASGKLEIKGDLGAVEQLSGIVPLEKKPAEKKEKKTVRKKTVEKKPPIEKKAAEKKPEVKTDEKKAPAEKKAEPKKDDAKPVLSKKTSIKVK